jgi:hypothetical protein
MPQTQQLQKHMLILSNHLETVHKRIEDKRECRYSKSSASILRRTTAANFSVGDFVLYASISKTRHKLQAGKLGLARARYVLSDCRTV